MKKLIVISLSSVLFFSCVKEEIPSGLILEEELNTKDTTYITTTIPVAQPKNILVEEATGVLCKNCPDGARLLKSIKDQYPNRILSAAVYSPFLNEFHSPSTHDFNSKDAADLVTYLGGDPSKPSAAIDRTNTGNTALPYFYQKPDWASKMGQLILKKTPVNITLNSDKSGDNYVLKSSLTFTDTITSSLGISLYLIEDSIVNYQIDNSTAELNYVHNHVMVKILTPLSGSVFLNDIVTKEKGRVFERSFVFQLPNNVVDKKHCHLLCFVHRIGSSREVLHAEEIHL